MKVRCTLRNAACAGVTILTVLQAGHEPSDLGFPLLALGTVLLAALLLRAEPARRILTALGFLFCGIVSARFLLRVPLGASEETAWYVAPALPLLCVALGAGVSNRRRRLSYATSSVAVVTLVCAAAAILGYLLLSPIYPLDAGVLRSLALNCALAFCTWILMSEIRPHEGLSSLVCASLVLSGGLALFEGLSK